MLVIVTGYLLTCLYAVDKGMAFLGFLKFSILITFTIVLMQYKENQIVDIVNIIPIAGITMIILSILFKIIPFLPDSFFMPNGRIAGFFQYSNTFALFLLIGIIILLNSKISNKKKIIFTVFLLLGIYLTGSRLVFVLTAINFIIFAVRLKKIRKPILITFFVSICLTLGYALVTNNFNTMGRYLTTSIDSSTLLGRILYYKDAVKLIFQSPLGLGYKGYYYMQPAIQTGVYNTVYVHNDIIQLILDIGIIPTIIFCIALIKNLFNKEKFGLKKQILLTVLLHIILDFDLQFLSIFFILIISLKLNKGKRYIIDVNRKISNICICLISILYMYFGICTFLQYIGQSDISIKMYPNYTEANYDVMFNNTENNLDYANDIATKVLKTNNNATTAYRVKALYYLKNEQWKYMITNKQKSVELSKYDISNYEEYILMLSRAMTYYINNNNIKEAENCIKLVLDVPSIIDKVRENTDEIAYKIFDVPNFELNEETKSYIEKMKGVKK